MKGSNKSSASSSRAAAVVPGAVLVSAGIGGAALDGEGSLSGRVTRFHNTPTKNVESILNNGLDGTKTLDPKSYTNRVLRGAASKDGRPLVYTTRSRILANRVGKARRWNGYDTGNGKTLKIKIPVDVENQRRVLDNPELRGLTKSEWTRKGKSPLTYKWLDARDPGLTRIYKDKIESQYIKGSKNYKGISIKEWTNYVKKNPGRFGKGILKYGTPVAVGAGLIAYGLKGIKKKDKKGDKKFSEVSDETLKKRAEYNDRDKILFGTYNKKHYGIRPISTITGAVIGAKRGKLLGAAAGATIGGVIGNMARKAVDARAKKRADEAEIELYKRGQRISKPNDLVESKPSILGTAMSAGVGGYLGGKSGKLTGGLIAVSKNVKDLENVVESANLAEMTPKNAKVMEYLRKLKTSDPVKYKVILSKVGAGAADIDKFTKRLRKHKKIGTAVGIAVPVITATAGYLNRREIYKRNQERNRLYREQWSNDRKNSPRFRKNKKY